MLLEDMQNGMDSDVEFSFERPIGWSSACLDSTINYYLNCNYQETGLEENMNEEKYNN